MPSSSDMSASLSVASNDAVRASSIAVERCAHIARNSSSKEAKLE
jgi:hypothetical protein